MIAITCQQVAEAVGALFMLPEPGGDSRGLNIRRVGTDSRDVQRGELFVALRGPNHDGHKYVQQAVAKGAVACLADRSGAQEFAVHVGVPVIVVEDTVAALGRLAAWYRRSVMRVGTTVIAVTGSNGKTTTKNMIEHVLRRGLKGFASPKSFNNQFGVPLTLLMTDADDRFVVAEVGTNAPGEIAHLAGMVAPHVGVITSIGEAHLEGLGGIAGVAAEKCSLLDHIQTGGLAVVNIDRAESRGFVQRCRHARMVTVGTDPDAKLTVAGASTTLSRTTFVLEGRYRIELPMPGTHHATNAAAAFAVARWLGMDCAEIIDALGTFVPADGRTRRLTAGGATIIDDAYNANPSSVGAAIAALRDGAGCRRVFVLGDMLELGDNSGGLHERVVRMIAESGIEVFVGVGSMVIEAAKRIGPGRWEDAYFCDDAAAAGELLPGIIRAGDAVWIKGSRAMHLDRVVRRLVESTAEPSTTARRGELAVA